MAHFVEERPDLANDPHRPRYHFLPPANWLNDPNGLIQWKGQYHLFYQYNPHGPFHGTIHWGHAVSDDLVHWRDLPIALAPSAGGPDKDGCYSGCAVDNGGVPTLVYTGIRPEVQCVATSADDLLTWQKAPGNPVIPAPPEGLRVTGFRDPFVWRESDVWYAVLGSGIKDVGGTILLYRSPDLIHWDYLGQLCSGRKAETGTMWECPNFFPLGDKHVLIISPVPLRKVLYVVGPYAHHRFTPEKQGIVDDGGHFYAPQTMLDDQGRRLMWGWLRDLRSEELRRASGWAGVMSVPTVLDLRPDATLGIQPVPELASLRGEHWRRLDLDVAPGGASLLADVQGDALEMLVEIEQHEAAELGLVVRRSTEGEEWTSITFNPTRGELSVDRTHSSLDPVGARDVRSVDLHLSPGEPLRLHVFLDRSVLEVFANGRVSLMSLIYPSRADSQGVELIASGGNARLRSLDVWAMRSIWEGRRTAR